MITFEILKAEKPYIWIDAPDLNAFGTLVRNKYNQIAFITKINDKWLVYPAETFTVNTNDIIAAEQTATPSEYSIIKS